MDLVDSPAQIDQHRHNLLRVETSAKTKLADRTLLAVEPQPIRFLVSKQFIVHIVKRVSAEDCGHGILDFLIAHPGASPDLDLVHQVKTFPVIYSGDLNSRHKHFPYPDVISRIVAYDSPVRPDDLLQRVKLVSDGQGGLVAPVDDGVNAAFVEAEHIVLVQVRLDVDIRDVYVGLERGAPQHVDAGVDDVSKIIDLVVALVATGKIDTDHDVSPDLLGKVCRVVVPHAAVNQHHAADPDRGEESRNRHRGTESRVEFALGPDLGGTGHEVGRHAKKRNRKVIEISHILITDGKRAEYVVDILAIDHSGRKAPQKVVLDHVRGVGSPRAEVDVLDPSCVPTVGVLHLQVLILVIKEREGQDISLLVFD